MIQKYLKNLMVENNSQTVNFVQDMVRRYGHVIAESLYKKDW